MYVDNPVIEKLDILWVIKQFCKQQLSSGNIEQQLGLSKGAIMHSITIITTIS